jgi:putative Ca2+/H+ antiporter (TMEM165/GDT1 family)
MVEFLGAMAIALGAIFLAEFGDKSQLLVLAFATRYPWRPVVAGVVIAAAIVQGASVIVGAALGAVLPEMVVAVVSGLAFLAVAAWTLLGEDDDDNEQGRPSLRPLAGTALVLTVAGTFIAAELGDKTMLATFALAANQGPIPTWIGSTLGEVAANLVAVAVGSQLGHRLSPRLVRIGSAVVFALAGVAVLAGAFAT